MVVRQRLWGGVRELGRVAVVAGMCAVLVEQPVLAEAAVWPDAHREGKAGAGAAGEVQGSTRVLHALNRFTFGPRPGDVAAVQKMGLDRWFEQQLNPAGIDDSTLEQRLAQYPAMSMSIAELEQRYPGPQMIRQMMNGKVELPRDPMQRAMAEDQIALYRMQKAKQEAAKAPETGDGETKGSQVVESRPLEKFKAGTEAPATPGMMQGVEKAVPAAEIAPDGMAAGDGVRAYPREGVVRLLEMTPGQRVQAILAMKPEELAGLRKSLKGSEQQQLTAGMTPMEKETLLALGGSLRMVALEEMESRLERDIYSNRQLEAVMTDFWLNHFNVYVRKNQNEAFLIPTYERETIRAHALGNFEDLLVATAESPAMQEYLDNFRSIGPNSDAARRVKKIQEMRPNGKLAKAGSAGLNENYGRELMELHTLGVNGGYTQADVTNVAKVFTGWGIEKPNQPGGGTFAFDERKHEPGSKTVLGKTIHEDGMKEGLEVLHMLAQSPATAHFISEKLAVRFVSDDPSAALVDRMAASYMASHGDIKTVLRTMWKSPEFWAPTVIRAKVKTPEEFVVSAVRASGADVINPAALVQSVAKLGMPLYGMQTPQGYSWKQDDWVSTGALVSRMNFALVLAGDRIPGVRTEWGALLASDGRPGVVAADYSGDDAVKAKEHRLEMDLVGQPVSDKTRAAVLGQANDASVTEQAETQFDLRGPGGKGQGRYRQGGMRASGDGAPDDAQAAVMAGLLIGSPEFQRR